MQRALWVLYQAAMALAMALAGPVLLARRGRHYWRTIPERWQGGRRQGAGGPGVAPGRQPLWIHAVSVGEVGVAATLARALPADLPLLITTITPTGQERARAVLGERAEVAYLPFDLGLPIGRFLRRHSPRALILVEGDYWPLLLSRCRERGVPVAVVNGRLSDRSFPRLSWLARRVPRLLRPLFGVVERFGVQTDADRDRLLALGVAAEKLAVTGNLKFETPEPAARPELEARLAELAAGRPILVAGSTMAGEEEAVLDAFAGAGGGERALLVLAPRHPERFADVERLLLQHRLVTVRRSALGTRGAPVTDAARLDALLLDTVGELAALYRLAAGSFIGGTLVPTGGHNPLEAARFGVPVAVGPAMENFRDMAERFDLGAAWQRVATAADLAAAWRGWLDDPAAAQALGARAAALLEANRGALARTLELLAPFLQAPVPRRAAG